MVVTVKVTVIVRPMFTSSLGRKIALACLGILACAAGLASCAFAKPTTPTQAAGVVTNWLRRDPRPLGTMLGHRVAKVTAYKDAKGLRAYFVVSLRPSGFVIVSADDLIEPIVAFAASGTYNPSPRSPLGERMVAARKPTPRRAMHPRRVSLLARPIRGRHKRTGEWSSLLGPTLSTLNSIQSMSTLSDPRVDPFVSSHWGQTTVDDTETGLTCYNYSTPNNYCAGCVAAAMAQLMRFHQYPTLGVGSQLCPITVDGVPRQEPLLGGDGAGGPYNWADMPLDPDASVTSAQRQAIGALCHDAGTAAQMSYTYAGSGTRMLYAYTALRYGFMYGNAKCAADTVWLTADDRLYKMINPNLQAGLPVLLGIFREENGELYGHAVVCDGYGYNASTIYHHLNMGWIGTDDAWYNLPNIDALKYQYTAISDCLYNVYPTGTGEIICGRVTDEAGNPLSSANVTANSYSTSTNSRGLYALAKVPAHTTYSMKVSAPGYLFAPRAATTGTSSDVGLNCGNLWGVDFAGQPESDVADAKKMADGITVGCEGLLVSAVFGDYFYAQEENRSSGICVHKVGHDLSIGKHVDVIGDMSTNPDGERLIEASSTVKSDGSEPRPLGMTNKLLGGGDWYCVPRKHRGPERRERRARSQQHRPAGENHGEGHLRRSRRAVRLHR